MPKFCFLPEESPTPANRSKRTLHGQKPPLKPRSGLFVPAFRFRANVVVQQKTGHPVQFELTEQTCQAVYAWLSRFTAQHEHMNTGDTQMKNFLIFLLGAIVGGVASFFLAGAFFTGVGAGVGIATGLQAGACLAVEAAKDEGLITAEQVDEVLVAAVRQMAEGDLADNTEVEGSDLNCQQVVAQLKEAAKKTE
jgi:hypothetical protein